MGGWGRKVDKGKGRKRGGGDRGVGWCLRTGAGEKD